jgi:hypothetical protein
MPAHPKAFARMANELRAARSRDHQDQILDRWNDAALLATEWDADQWGFDPDRWMAKERAQLGSDS